MHSLAKYLVGALVLSTSCAHPGHDIHAEAWERAAWLHENELDLHRRCSEHFENANFYDAAARRRRALFADLRSQRGLDHHGSGRQFSKRDVDDVLNTDHNLTAQHPGWNIHTPEKLLFGDNSSCILQPEGRSHEGPFYVQGEDIRSNLVENQRGAELVLDVQLVDINTCQPVHDTYLEFWHANATGVYSGAVDHANAYEDKANINTTWLRGIQPTDELGVAQVTTIFPGRYAGRTAHIHILAHQGARKLRNGTLEGDSGRITHVGQLFFDQGLIDPIMSMTPYSLNHGRITTNAQDGLFNAESDTTDPVVKFVYLGDELSDGLFAWITFGIDSTADIPVNPIAFHGDHGGIENPDRHGPGGPGGPGRRPGDKPHNGPPRHGTFVSEDQEEGRPYGPPPASWGEHEDAMLRYRPSGSLQEIHEEGRESQSPFRDDLK